MKVAVHDACVLVDLEEVGLLEQWLALEIEGHIPDLVTDELRNGGHDDVLRLIESGRIQEHSFDETELAQIWALLAAIGSSISLEDASALFLAQALGAGLLTGDGPLRQAGKERRVDVHGLLWILDRMVDRKILTPSRAADKLGLLRSGGSRLPEGEVNLRLDRWRPRPAR